MARTPAADLEGQMTLDTTPWDTALNKAQAKADAFADKVEHKISKKVSKLFGAGLIAGTIISPLHKVFDALFEYPDEHAKDIKDKAADLHVTAEEYQLLEAGAKAAGLSIEEFIKKLQKMPGGSSAAFQALQGFRKQVELTNEEVDRMTDHTLTKYLQEFGMWLNKTGGTVLHFASDMSMLGQMVLAGTPLREAIKQINADTAAQKKNKEAEDKVASSGLASKLNGSEKYRPDFQINELQKIGAYVGSASTVEDNTKRTAAATERTAAATEKLATTLTHGEPSFGMGLGPPPRPDLGFLFDF